MRQKTGIIFLVVVGVIFLGAMHFVFAQEEINKGISAAELLKDPLRYNGKKILYVGEIVGDIMVRKEGAWINLKKDNFVLGIWLNKKQIGKDWQPGGYQRQGTILAVEGIFNTACLLHGGDTDLHAEKARVVKEAEITREILDKQKLNLVIGLSGVMILLWIWKLLRDR